MSTMKSLCALMAWAGLGLMPVTGVAQPAASFDWFAYSGADRAHAGLAATKDSYLNPVLQGFYPDPSITRVGSDYYLVTSTFSYFPGIPVFHSRDLVTWRQIGNAIDRPGQLDFGRLGLSRGVFAPAIEHHGGVFYIFNTCVDCGGNFVITATNPAGPWSEPTWLPDLRDAIDPSLFVDSDGTAWVLNNGPPDMVPQYDGHRAVWIQRFDLKTLSTFGPRTVLVNGGVDFSTKPIWIEGPHIIKKDGWYYLICAEGGTAEGHSQVVLRSRAPDGPYVAWEGNPILTQRGLPRERPHAITSAGHADFVQTPDGTWWATFLAVRPYEGDHYNTGRETFLMPVDWSGEWPRITGPGDVIPYQARRPALPRDTRPAPRTSGAFAWRDSFDQPRLDASWMMMRNPVSDWFSLTDRRGALTLKARPVSLGDKANPSFLGRRLMHQTAMAEISVRFTPEAEADEAGLVALQSDEYWFAAVVGVRDGEPVARLRRRAGPSDPVQGTVVAEVPLQGRQGAAVRFRASIDGEKLAFSVRGPRGGWTPLGGPQDGKLLSTRVAGGFVGATLGPYAYGGAR